MISSPLWHGSEVVVHMGQNPISHHLPTGFAVENFNSSPSKTSVADVRMSNLLTRSIVHEENTRFHV